MPSEPAVPAHPGANDRQSGAPSGASLIRLEGPPPVTVLPLAAVALLAGLSMLAGGSFAFDPGGALAGLLGQLGTTLPAAILIMAATAVNVAAGLVLVRRATGRLFWTPAEAMLAGFVGAALLDIVLLGALGGTGTFRWPVLAIVHGAVFATGRGLPLWVTPGGEWPPRWTGRSRVRLAALPGGLPAWWPLWAVAGLLWSGMLLVQLASPVVPFVDVLPNHVAPVEHLRTFGDFASLTTTASPIYGPSRTFLGYAALLGVVDTLANLPAALGVAAFALPGAIAVALGLHRLGSALGGGQTGAWAVLAFVLTTSFVRLPDARATVLVLPLAAWCLAEVADRVAGRQPPTLRGALLLGGGLGATILVHPVIGALTFLAVGLTTLGWPGPTRSVAVPAVLMAAVLALPQLAAMTEIAVPTAVSLVAIPAAIVLGWLAWRVSALPTVLVWLGRAAAVLIALLAMLWASEVLGAAQAALDKLIPTIPILAWTSLAGLLIGARRMLNPVVLGALAAGVIAATATNLVPQGGTLMTALRFEVPKTLHYWVPVVFTLGAAIALDTLWRDDRLPVPLPRLALVAFLMIAILPLRGAPLTDAYYLGERRASETISLQLQIVQRGYWQGYPDARTLVAGDQLGLLAALRGEIDAGRLGPADGVLHVARSFQQWVAVPLGVFTGVIETDATPDAEVSIHTVGGRLRPFAELGTLLGGPYPYLVLEPDGLPGDTRARITAAGYHSIYANARGELFARAS